MSAIAPQARRWTAFIALVLACFVAVPASSSFAAQKSKDKKSKNAGPSNAPTTTGKPIMWMDRGNIAGLDLIHGIGSAETMPKPPFTFVKEDVSGTNPKIRITDANGMTWNMKFDEEVHAEIAGSRFAWACGYMVEESHYVASGTVQGVSGLGRAKKFVGSDGSFTAAMFERRPDDIARRKTPWSWDSNPFVGTKELSGLAILAVMMNNWDAKVDNNNVLGMWNEDKSAVNEWYIVADWGGTFGKMGGVFSHSKWDIDAFNKQGFIKGVSGGRLQLEYSGKGGSILKSVPLEHARWFAGIIGQLTDAQLADAFRAAGATPAEVSGFSARMRSKINELKAAVR